MIITLKEILQYAEKEGKAVGMFNATGFDSIQAIIAAAESLNEPIIIAHAEVHNIYNDISLVGPAMMAAAKEAKVPVCVHLDHGMSKKIIDKAIELGFTGIMVDASAMPFEDNLELTSEVVRKCHAKGIAVEAELGRLAENAKGNAKASDFYTDPEQAAEFAEKTGIDALAIAFGTSHGFYKAKPVLDFGVIENCRKSTGLPLVMHGGSGVSAEDYTKSIQAGIRKINYYSYMSKAGYKAACDVINSGTTSYFHELAYKAMFAMRDNVGEAIKIFSGRNEEKNY